MAVFHVPATRPLIGIGLYPGFGAMEELVPRISPGNPITTLTLLNTHPIRQIPSGFVFTRALVFQLAPKKQQLGSKSRM